MRGARAYMRDILKDYPEICKKSPENRTRNEQRRVDIVDAALSAVDCMQNAQDRRKFIDMVYFKQSHTIAGAALQVHICERLAFEWNNAFMQLMIRQIDLP